MNGSSQLPSSKYLGSTSLSLLAALVWLSCGSAEESDVDLPPSFVGTTVNPAQQQSGAVANPSTQPAQANNPGNTAAQQPTAQASNERPQSAGLDGNQQPTSNGQQNSGEQVDTEPQGAGGATGMDQGAAGATMTPEPSPPQNTGGSNMPAPEMGPVPPPSADCGTALLCDDFEGVAAGNSPDPALWDLIVGYNPTQGQTDSVQVTTAQAHSGSQSVFVSGDNGRTGMIGTIAADDYHVRAWMFAESAPLGPVLAGFGSDGNNEVRFRIWNNSWATINSTVGDDLVPQAARAGNCPDCPVVPAGQWFCMEYFVNNSAQTATLSIDGQEAAVLNGSWPNMPAEPQIFLGVMRIQDGANIYVDDVVASLNPIGCN